MELKKTCFYLVSYKFSSKVSCPTSELNISSLLAPKKKNLTETLQNSHLFSGKVISSLLFDPRSCLNIILYVYP